MHPSDIREEFWRPARCRALRAEAPTMPGVVEAAVEEVEAVVRAPTSPLARTVERAMAW